MIQIFVNNQELLLPEDFEVTIIEENPLITNNGEFTLDITLSLLEAKNAIAFGFLNRLNLTTIVKNAEARMIVDGNVSMGSVVIMSNTDVDVTFQFIAGNSELNYNIINDTRKIWELDWGSETTISSITAISSVNNTGYSQARKFVCAPIICGDKQYNNFTIGSGDYNTANVVDHIDSLNGKALIQPYLLYYINKLPSLLKFELASNCLNTDERAKNMYLVNFVDSLNYADMLPDMSISEFISAIEVFFNVTFKVNKYQKTIDIQNLILSERPLIKTSILDSYSRELKETEKRARFGDNTVSYRNADKDYFKYNKLNENIYNICEFLHGADYSKIETAMNYWADSKNNKFTIFIDDSTSDEWIILHINDNKPFLYRRKLNGDFYAYKLNKFKNKKGALNSVLEHLICPCSFTLKNIDAYFSPYDPNGPSSTLVRNPTQMPVSSQNFYSINTTQPLIDAIENSLSIIPRNNFIEVALYGGISNYKVYESSEMSPAYSLSYPLSYIDNSPEFNYYTDANTYYENWATVYYKTIAKTTLRLTGSNNVVQHYYPVAQIDLSTEYIFIIPDNPNIVVNNNFIINNTKFIPISFERIISNKKGTVKGRFYKIL